MVAAIYRHRSSFYQKQLRTDFQFIQNGHFIYHRITIRSIKPAWSNLIPIDPQPIHSQGNQIPKTLLMTKNHMASLQQSPLMTNQEWNNSKVPLMSINEIFLFFLSQFGLCAWGGHIAQIALIKKQLVMQGKWITSVRWQQVFFNSSCARSRRGAHFF